MDKKEIEHRLEQAKKDRMGINDNICWLKEQLAEAEKPKLGHGDFGISKRGNFIAIKSKSPDHHHGVEPFYEDCWSDGHLYTERNPNDFIVFGNIFDLMKEWGEDLEEFDVGGRHFKIYPEDPDSFLQIEEIWHKLGRMIFTRKRKQG